MADDFKQTTVTLRLDWFEALDELPGDEYKSCLQAVISYCLAGTEPDNLTPSAKIAFRFMKSWLDRDKKKAEEAHERRTKAGESGGKSTQAKQAEAGRSNASAYQAGRSGQKRAEAAEAESESESESELIDNTAADAAEYVEAVISHLNERCGTFYRPSTKDSVKTILARLRDGYTVDDLNAVIDCKADEWMNTAFQQYLRPKTLFAPSKFESYLQESRMKQTFTEDDVAYKAALWVARKNKKQNAAFPMPSEKELQKSAAEFEAVIRECMEGGDSRDEAVNRINEAAKMIERSEYWSETVIDGASFRKHYKKILAQPKDGDA